MARIFWNAFLGEVPHLEPRNLGPFHATVARGARLERGNLSPMRGNALVHTFPSFTRSFAFHEGAWLGWNADVDAVPGPTQEDRLYIVGDGAPRIRFEGQEYALALPAPTTAPAVAIVSGTVDPETAESVTFCYTWVTSLFEESPPSPLSDPITTSPGAAVRVNGLEATPPNRLISHQRIYRSQTSAAGVTELFFAGEIPATLKTLDHDSAVTPLNDPIPSVDYDPPPAGMKGIIALPNGGMAAFDGREVLLAEPYLPHAWPIKYRRVVDAPIVGLAAFGSTIAVLTQAQPYVMQGLAPDTMAMERSDESYPCLAKLGIVDLGYAAAYPSTDGLILIGPNGARNATEQLFTREQWAELNPSSFRAARLGPRYAFSYTLGDTTDRRLGFIDLSGEQPFFTTLAQGFVGLRFDETTARLLSTNSGSGVELRSIDDHAAAYGTFLWRSKPMRLPSPLSFGCVLVEGRTLAGSSDLTVRVLRDGIVTRSIGAGVLNQVHRLPLGEGQEWQVELEGSAEVTMVTLAGSPSELTGG